MSQSEDNDIGTSVSKLDTLSLLPSTRGNNVCHWGGAQSSDDAMPSKHGRTWTKGGYIQCTKIIWNLSSNASNGAPPGEQNPRWLAIWWS